MFHTRLGRVPTQGVGQWPSTMNLVHIIYRQLVNQSEVKKVSRQSSHRLLDSSVMVNAVKTVNRTVHAAESTLCNTKLAVKQV